MIELLAQNLAPIMFLSLVVFLLLGYPVAFSLAANGLMFFVLATELSPYSDSISLSWPLLGTLPGRILDVMRNDTLLAIPFFTFMGIILERSRMAEDLLETVGQLFGPGARRSGLCGHSGRRVAGGDDRRCCRVRHGHGTDLAPYHAALWL